MSKTERKTHRASLKTGLQHSLLALAAACLQSILPLVGAQRGDARLMAFARPAALAQFALVALAFAVAASANLPSIVLASGTLGLITRTTRASMLEAMTQAKLPSFGVVTPAYSPPGPPDPPSVAVRSTSSPSSPSKSPLAS